MNEIDPELMYCPVCDDEYRAEFTNCGLCKQDLVSGKELLAGSNKRGQEDSRESVIKDDDTLIPLQKGSLSDMKNLKRLLTHSSIPAVLVKDDANCGKGCCGPEVYIHIRAEDKERAYQVVRKEHEATTAAADYDLSTADAVFDQGAAMTICPACGHQFLPTNSSCPDCGLQFS